MLQPALSTQANTMTNAYCLALVAEAVYYDNPTAEYPPFFGIFDRVLPILGNRIRGLVSVSDNHVALAFRGAQEDKEWLEALVFGQIELEVGMAHRGLYSALDAIWDLILAALYDAEVDQRTLWLTGHSLGGALATIAAQRLKTEGLAPHMVCTFGAPPVLDAEAAAAFRVPLSRFVNSEDLVPNLPWTSPFVRYAHAGEEVFLLPSGRVAAQRHSRHLARRIDRADTIGEIHSSGPIHDHMMENYIEKLRRHVEDSTSTPSP